MFPEGVQPTLYLGQPYGPLPCWLVLTLGLCPECTCKAPLHMVVCLMYLAGPLCLIYPAGPTLANSKVRMHFHAATGGAHPGGAGDAAR